MRCIWGMKRWKPFTGEVRLRHVNVTWRDFDRLSRVFLMKLLQLTLRHVNVTWGDFDRLSTVFLMKLLQLTRLTTLQIWYLLNAMNNFDKTDGEYSLAHTDDLIRFWKSEVKVTAGRWGVEGILLMLGLWGATSALCDCHLGLSLLWHLQNISASFCRWTNGRFDLPTT